MSSERIKRRVERLLDQADAAAEAMDWARVKQSAEAVLAIDPDNADAQSFLVMAGGADAGHAIEDFGDIDRETEEALEHLSTVVAQNAQLRGNLQREVEDVTVLAAIGRIINSSLHIEEVYEPFARNVASVIPFDWLHLTEIDPDLDRARHMFMVGQEFEGRGRGEWWPLEGTFTQTVIAGRTGVTVAGETPEALKVKFPLLAPVIDGGARSFLSVPLIARDEVMGALQMVTNEGSAYSPRHMAVAERMGSQMARAV